MAARAAARRASRPGRRSRRGALGCRPCRFEPRDCNFRGRGSRAGEGRARSTDRSSTEYLHVSIPSRRRLARALGRGRGQRMCGALATSATDNQRRIGSRPATRRRPAPSCTRAAPITTGSRPVDTRTQDQAGGRAPFEFSTTTTQFVTLTLASRARDTLALTLILDSVAVTSTLDAPAPMCNPSAGRGWKGPSLLKAGSTCSHRPPERPTTRRSRCTARLVRFLAVVPAQLGPGTTWSDTTSDAFKRGRVRHQDLDGHQLEGHGRHDCCGPAMRGGWSAVRWYRHRARDGEGQADHLVADGTIRTVQLLTASGVYLGSTGTQTSRLQMSMVESAGGMSAPIQEVIRSTVEALRLGGARGSNTGEDE